MFSKKGIELSINFIVMLVLGMAMFFGGLMFVMKFFGEAETIKGTMDAQTQRQIEAMLDSGSPFVIPIHSKEIGRKKHDTFGVGVFNDGTGDASMTKFTLQVQFNSAFNPRTNAQICYGGICADDQKPVIKGAGEADIPVGAKHNFLLLAEVPPKTESGTYIYTVRIFKGIDLTQEYQPSLQLIVKVP